MSGPIHCLYLDHEKVGCGFRDYVALPGRKWCRLVLMSTGETIRLSMADFETARKAEYPQAYMNAKARARRLRRNAKTFGNDKSSAVRDALAALKGPKA